MPDMTHNTLALSGSSKEILELREFLENSTEQCWREIIQLTIIDHGKFSTLKMTLKTPWDPPLKEVDTMYRLFPTLKGIHRLTLEREWCETTVVRREPSRGFQKCLVDNPIGYKTIPSFEVADEYLEDLQHDEQLRAVSKLVGITLDRIRSRECGLIDSI